MSSGFYNLVSVIRNELKELLQEYKSGSFIREEQDISRKSKTEGKIWKIKNKSYFINASIM